MNKELLKLTLRNTLGAVIYIFLVSQLMQNGEKLFGKGDNFLTPFIVLMLFSLSAAIVGGLVLGLSIMLFFEGKKKESIQAAFYSIGWLSVFTILGLVTLIAIK